MSKYLVDTCNIIKTSKGLIVHKFSPVHGVPSCVNRRQCCVRGLNRALAIAAPEIKIKDVCASASLGNAASPRVRNTASC